jgi:WD40 repeat protein
MPLISQRFLQEALHRNQHHIYTFRHCLCGIRIRQFGELGDIDFHLFRQYSLPKVSVTIPLLTISTTSSITCVAFSPDGNQIVSGSSDNSVQVWDAKTGKQLKELRGHTDHVTSVAFSPDGDQIVSGSTTNQCGCGMQRLASS